MLGAVITAAGVSSRMGEFKPLLEIGSMTLIEKAITTLKESDVEKIVVVMGNQSERLAKYAGISGVTLVENENYLHSQMLDSIKLGLRHLDHRCEKILILPVDMPLFTKESIHTLTASQHDLTYISYHGKKGHPIMIRQNIVPRILDFDGELGLKGILMQIEDKVIIPVEDPGIIHDADTPENYQKLLQMFYQQEYRPFVELTILKNQPVMSQNIAQILYLIESTHSLKETQNILKISQASLQEIITSLQQELGYPILCIKEDDEVDLTSQIKDFLRRYRLFEKQLNKVAQELFNQIMIE